MKNALRLLALTLSLSLLGGCAATIPVKAAYKTTKVGVKTAKVGVKTTAKIATAAIPDGEKQED